MYKPDNDYSGIHLITNCPLSLFKDGLNDRTVHNALFYSLYKFSRMVDYNMEVVCEYVLKKYYSNFEEYSINQTLYQLDLKHFGKKNHYQQQSELEIDDLIEVFKTFKEIEEEAIECYQVYFILQHFMIFGHVPTILMLGKNLYFETVKDNPQPMINIDIRSLIYFKNSGVLRRIESE